MFAFSTIVLRGTQTNWIVQKERARVWKRVPLREVQKLSLLSLEKRRLKRGVVVLPYGADVLKIVFSCFFHSMLLPRCLISFFQVN